MRNWFLLLIAVGALALTRPVPAAQDDHRLAALFQRLQTADPMASRAIEERIWEIWTESENAAVSRLMARGILAMAHEDLAGAVRSFSAVTHLAPGYAEGWNKRATAHYLAGDFDASVRDIARTLELEPRHFGALSGFGLINLALGREAPALKAFERALEVHPHLSGTRERIRALRERLKGKAL